MSLDIRSAAQMILAILIIAIIFYAWVGYRSIRRARGRLSHVVWELEAVKPRQR